MADYLAAALLDLEGLAHELGVSWSAMDGEVDRQLQVLDYWDGRGGWVMDYEVELVVRNHVSLIRLDPEFCELSELCAFFAVIRGVSWVLGWRADGRLVRLHSFEELWERYLDLREQIGDEPGGG